MTLRTTPSPIAHRIDLNALFAEIFAVVDMLDRQRVSKHPDGFTQGDTVVSPDSSGLFFIQLKALGTLIHYWLAVVL